MGQASIYQRSAGLPLPRYLPVQQLPFPRSNDYNAVIPFSIIGSASNATHLPMFSFLNQLFSSLFFSTPVPAKLNQQHRAFLTSTVSFYAALNASERLEFESRCVSFIQSTVFIGHQLEVSDEDKLLVAAGSVILAWGFPQWHYVKVGTVYLVATTIGQEVTQDSGSAITGMVGTQHLSNKLFLSQPALHQGFSNDRDKRNVAIHEFAHLIDLADGDIDGLPQQLTEHSFALPWLDLVKQKISDINQRKSDIRDYGATNNAEFFAVISEYFFERPKLLKRKHPEIYQALQKFYRQDRAAVQQTLRIRKKAPCPCGSGKRFKRCCMLSET
ncbi:zinc-dependent peptidase [Arenicella xantha]|uniref:Peptidase n=1 Tax=Arenicella xantha TaxID=644221 RepID=A0A395JMM9_9GAMM|nr:zinc-dependent peptidase [Arenicella xantha]RBP51087.1 hypothetical protein DFR28_102506 [Arenicella xantha]